MLTALFAWYSQRNWYCFVLNSKWIIIITCWIIIITCWLKLEVSTCYTDTASCFWNKLLIFSYMDFGNISSLECKKVVSAILSFCEKSIFVLRFPLYFIVFWHIVSSTKNVNTLSWDLYHDSKCVILHVLSISTTNSILPKMSLTTFLHSHDDLIFNNQMNNMHQLLHMW